MSDLQEENGKSTDPLEQWREIRDSYMGAWAKVMADAVNTEAYSKGSGVMLDTFLTTSAPFRDVQKKLMVSTLEQLNMPSRADFVSLAERMTNMELLLDDMAVKLNQIHQFVSNPATPPASSAKPENEASFSKIEAASKSSVGKRSPEAAKKRSS